MSSSVGDWPNTNTMTWPPSLKKSSRWRCSNTRGILMSFF
jgi:hypothetical protein